MRDQATLQHTSPMKPVMPRAGSGNGSFPRPLQHNSRRRGLSRRPSLHAVPSRHAASNPLHASSRISRTVSKPWSYGKGKRTEREGGGATPRTKNVRATSDVLGSLSSDNPHTHTGGGSPAACPLRILTGVLILHLGLDPAESGVKEDGQYPIFYYYPIIYSKRKTKRWCG